MTRTAIACYRPKPARSEALDALISSHFARLYTHGFVTRRLPTLLRAGDGALLEIFEWKSPEAAQAAHNHPAVLELWQELEAVCEYAPLAALAEANRAFADFEAAAIEVARPPFFDVYNHVQVDARISTSGIITVAAIAEMVRERYAGVINLLPDDNRHALAAERDLVREKGLDYHYVPVDFAAPSGEDYRAFERAMAAFTDSDKVYVHCAANMRVSAFMAVYGVEHLGWSLVRARQHVAEVWKPDEVWQRFLAGRLPVST